MDDGFLIRQVLGGNRDAFRLLIVRYQRPLFRFLGGFGLDQAAAEELAQETFLRAFRDLSGYDASKASFSSWLFTIAKHLAMNETVSSRRRAPHVDEHLARDRNTQLLRSRGRVMADNDLLDSTGPFMDTSRSGDSLGIAAKDPL